ncbi:hypothetical protein DFH11DRAFT_1600597 [Phellopilus nigrolimitatus]|nr:hypothetical protein DFH11DRAFT_1600597 [Phellopilus nigrolimitatus]
MPLLFRVLAAVMSPLAALSPHPPATPTELRVIKTVAAFLKGPYSITSLILLRQFLHVATQIAPSLGALHTLRVQTRRVPEDRMAMRVVRRDTAASATHAVTPGNERVFEEVAALLKDVLQEMDERVEDGGETGNGCNDYDTAAAVGRVLFEMTDYVKTLKCVFFLLFL